MRTKRPVELNDAALFHLAKLFSGVSVAHNSVALLVPGTMSQAANEYFGARNALGIVAYPDHNAVALQLRKVLYGESE